MKSNPLSSALAKKKQNAMGDAVLSRSPSPERAMNKNVKVGTRETEIERQGFRLVRRRRHARFCPPSRPDSTRFHPFLTQDADATGVSLVSASTRRRENDRSRPPSRRCDASRSGPKRIPRFNRRDLSPQTLSPPLPSSPSGSTSSRRPQRPSERETPSAPTSGSSPSRTARSGGSRAPSASPSSRRRCRRAGQQTTPAAAGTRFSRSPRGWGRSRPSLSEPR